MDNKFKKPFNKPNPAPVPEPVVPEEKEEGEKTLVSYSPKAIFEKVGKMI